MPGRGFKAQQPKGRNVYVALMVVVVVAGFFLQLDWIRRMREQNSANIAPNALADKLGQWMLETKGVEAGGAAAAPGVETIECGNCLGTGSVLSEDGRREMCPICMGVGSRLIRRLDPADKQCPACGGMGRVKWPDTGKVDTCPRCQGRGLIRRPAAAEPAPDEKP